MLTTFMIMMTLSIQNIREQAQSPNDQLRPLVVEVLHSSLHTDDTPCIRLLVKHIGSDKSVNFEFERPVMLKNWRSLELHIDGERARFAYTPEAWFGPTRIIELYPNDTFTAEIPLKTIFVIPKDWSKLEVGIWEQRTTLNSKIGTTNKLVIRRSSIQQKP